MGTATGETTQATPHAARVVCVIDGCERPVAVRYLHLCHAHVMRLWRGHLCPDTPIREYRRGRICRDCDRPVGKGSRGRCTRCLTRWRTAGQPTDEEIARRAAAAPGRDKEERLDH